MGRKKVENLASSINNNELLVSNTNGINGECLGAGEPTKEGFGQGILENFSSQLYDVARI